jgi:hypothetical protein
MNDMVEEMSEDMNEESAATEKMDDLLPTFKDWVDGGMAEDDIIVKLHEEHGLTYPSAVAKYRKLKSQAGMTSPRGHKSEDVIAFIKENHDEGKSRKEIIEGMIEEFGYTPKSAASTFSIQGKKLGIAGTGEFGSRQTVPLSDTVSFLRANYHLPKQELIAKMKEELGYAESTCNAFYIYVPMAIEWAKQENNM